MKKVNANEGWDLQHFLKPALTEMRIETSLNLVSLPVTDGAVDRLHSAGALQSSKENGAGWVAKQLIPPTYKKSSYTRLNKNDLSAFFFTAILNGGRMKFNEKVPKNDVS